MTDKTRRKPKPVIDLYRYIILTILFFIVFSLFDIISDGDPDGLRGFWQFISLVTGA